MNALLSASTVLSCHRYSSKQTFTLPSWSLFSSDENKQKYFKYKEPEIAKKELGDALKQGEEIPGVELVENKNLQIK